MLAKKNNGSVLLKLGIVLVVLAGVGWVIFQNLQGTAKVKAVNRDTAIDAVTGSVVVEADGGFKQLKSEAAGKVKVANIKPGSHFKEGDVLVQLDTSELDRQKAEATRKYKDAKARAKMIRDSNPEKKVAEEKLENAKRLFKLGNAAEDDVNSLQRAFDAIESKLEVADFDDKKAEADYEVAMKDFEIAREKMSVVATFDGTIHNDGAMTWEGALVSVGQPVTYVFSRKRVVVAKISEESFGRVKVGQPAKIHLLTYGSQDFVGTVSELLPSADDAQRFTVHLEVNADPDLLRPLSTGEVTITVDQQPNQMMILRRSVFDSNKVFVVKNGRVERRTLEIGYVALNVVQVRKGLEVGDLVIVDRIEEFREGQHVRVETVN